MNKTILNIMKASFVAAIILLAANFFLAGPANNNSEQEESTDTLKVIEPQNYFTLENQLITTLLSRYHYTHVNLDDSLSSMLFTKYLENLDNNRVYFYASDIAQLEKERYSFDDYLLAGNIQPFFDIYNLYEERMMERMDYVDTILVNGFDFTKNDSLEINRDNSNWANSTQAMDRLWTERIKNDALNLSLSGKTEDEIVSNLKKRYDNYIHALSQYNSEDVFQLAMDSYTTSIDPHTDYFSPVTSENFKIDMSLSLEGIGARLMTEDGYTKVVEIIPGGPAFKSKKLNADDRIIAVAQGVDGE
ncbi:MAG: hypothetical protein OQK65_05475, partial [Chlorobium sp.]|nr:hypothetical protein [Chlorobium sp.]